MKFIYSNDNLDKWLIDNLKSIMRVGDFTKCNLNILWKCLDEKCNHEWETAPSTIKGKEAGCPKCAHSKYRLTNNDMDEFISANNLSIVRIDDVAGCMIKNKWQCTIDICKNVWEAKPNDVKNGRGCPQCNTNFPLTNSIIDSWITTSSKSFKRISQINGSHSHTEWKCNKCKHQWKATPNNVRCNGSECPKCAGNIPLSNECVDKYLVDYSISIKRIGKVDGATTPIKWQCLKENCNYVWETSPSSIKNGTSCPACNSSQGEKLIASYLKQNNIEYIPQYKIHNGYTKRGYFKVDFLIPNINLIIEYNGQQHYQLITFSFLTKDQAEKKFELQQKRDEFIRSYCKENNFHLMEIDGRKYKNHKLINFINDSIRTY